MLHSDGHNQENEMTLIFFRKEMPLFDKRMNYKNIHWLVFGLRRLSTN